jgi:hypothetical protein
MASRPTTLERASELANSGEYTGIHDIKPRLVAEGYHDAGPQLYGNGIAGQIRRICRQAKERAAR